MSRIGLFSRAAALSVAFSATVLGAAALSGCTTQAYCFRDCDGTSTGSTTSQSGTGGGGGSCINCTSTISIGTGGGGSSTGSGGCQPSGPEVCDGVDNDCNGAVDDIAGLDLASPKTCGTCDNNCLTIAGSYWAQDKVTCTPSADPGKTPGTCHGECADDFYDIDKDPAGLCEYYCIKVADDDKTCDNVDDNCDGHKDEDVDLCTSVDDCGYCGHKCTLANATAQCVKTGGAALCDATNTHCGIATCTCNGPGDCYWDIDGNPANGCEYACTVTNGGVEICDGLDNDCNGVTDDNPTDAQLGTTCFGGSTGACADPTAAGTWACVAGALSCTGPNVITPGKLTEKCNGVDDDCNGVVDDNPTDTGPSFICGQSGSLPCQKGTLQCINGLPVCYGNIDPQPEVCDGFDNDCNGTPDDNVPGMGLPCNVPTPPPAGATSPCKAGTTACGPGGTICSGSTLPTAGAVDTCGVDANCDGQLTNQPDLQTDVHHCGSCANDCTTGAIHSTWACVAGQCVFQGCDPGYFDNGGGTDIAGDHKCAYRCIFNSAQEQCNGLDDNCDGQIDENVVAPSPVQVCGVSTNAATPECLPYNAATNPGGVSVTCQGGAWKCTFATAGVCNPTCAAASEVCETSGAAIDNNCNGIVNENVANWGQPCTSDQGLPAPGHGVCRTTGTYVCATPTTTACNAVKDNTKAGPELCDGIDNDCDGLVDEAFNNPGTNKTYFVKPVVTHVQANPNVWIYTYEASRPSATSITAGTGNGYYTSAPAGKTLDQTPACSAPGKIPWFDMTGVEVDQTCAAMGGHTCSPGEWQTACFAKAQPSPSCTYGYGTGCTSGFVTGTTFCNLAASYDFDPAAPGVQTGLLPTASSNLANCWADWSGVLGNVTGTSDKIFDITGNLREITKAATNQYTLMGGAFDSTAESGATCGFTFYNVDQSFQFFDTGFRCCFSQDPTVYTCGDGAKDGSETDVDCGGIACPKCATGKVCATGTDCVSGVCNSTTKKCQ